MGGGSSSLSPSLPLLGEGLAKLTWFSNPLGSQVALRETLVFLKRENQVALVTRKAGMSNAGARKERRTWLCEGGRWPACCFRETPWAGF